MNYELARKIAWPCSVLTFLVLIWYFSYFLGMSPRHVQTFVVVDPEFNSAILISLIISIAPVAFVEHVRFAYYTGLDKEVPGFLSAISEHLRPGITLMEALELAHKGKRLKPVIERGLKKYYLGFGLEEVLDVMALTKSELVSRAVAAIRTAYEAGGKVSESIAISASIFSEVIRYREERVSKTRPHLAIGYLALSIYLFVSISVMNSLFPVLTRFSGIAFPITPEKIPFYEASLLYGAIVISICGGLLSAKFNLRSVMPGLKHSLVMLIMTYLAFYVVYPMLGGYAMPSSIRLPT